MKCGLILMVDVRMLGIERVPCLKTFVILVPRLALGFPGRDQECPSGQTCPYSPVYSA